MLVIGFLGHIFLFSFFLFFVISFLYSSTFIISFRLFLILGLVALVLVRWIVVIMMIKGFPALESHDGFYFHHGGDQDYYFEYGEVLAQGSFDRYFAVNLGQLDRYPATKKLAQ